MKRVGSSAIENSKAEKRTVSFSARPPHAPYLSGSMELGYCLEFIAAQMDKGGEEWTNLSDLLRLIDNLWLASTAQIPDAKKSLLSDKASATIGYVRRKIYALQLAQDSLAHSADPFLRWEIKSYREVDANVPLEKAPTVIRGAGIKSLLKRLLDLPSSEARDQLLAAFGEQPTMLWRAFISTTDYTTTIHTVNWPLLRAAYDREVSGTGSSVYAGYMEDALCPQAGAGRQPEEEQDFARLGEEQDDDQAGKTTDAYQPRMASAEESDTDAMTSGDAEDELSDAEDFEQADDSRWEGESSREEVTDLKTIIEGFGQEFITSLRGNDTLGFLAVDEASTLLIQTKDERGLFALFNYGMQKYNAALVLAAFETFSKTFPRLTWYNVECIPHPEENDGSYLLKAGFAILP